MYSGSEGRPGFELAPGTYLGTYGSGSMGRWMVQAPNNILMWNFDACLANKAVCLLRSGQLLQQPPPPYNISNPSF